jgi:DNA-binding NarL/FixJ family response regulator
MTRVMLIDDHFLFLDGLELVLKRTRRYQVVRKVNDPLQAIDLMGEERVDMALVDIQMPGINGIDLLKRIQSRFPLTKVVMISMHEEDEFIHEARMAGGSGFLLKSMDSDKLVEALDSIVKGARIFPPRKTRKVGSTETFSERELEILRLLAKGKNSYEISETLFITLHTVKTHRRNMLRKLNASNTSQLLKIGFDNNLI